MRPKIRPTPWQTTTSIAEIQFEYAKFCIGQAYAYDRPLSCKSNRQEDATLSACICDTVCAYAYEPARGVALAVASTRVPVRICIMKWRQALVLWHTVTRVWSNYLYLLCL